jgi:flagellar basal body-associated protein FliL
MNKDILFIIVIFILVILGIYFVFFSGGISMNPAFNTLNNIKSDAQIDFSSIQKYDFT